MEREKRGGGDKYTRRTSSLSLRRKKEKIKGGKSSPRLHLFELDYYREKGRKKEEGETSRETSLLALSISFGKDRVREKRGEKEKGESDGGRTSSSSLPYQEEAEKEKGERKGRKEEGERRGARPLILSHYS